MKDLLSKAVLIIGMLIIGNSVFAQPGPPPGPPTPILVTNYSGEPVVFIASELNHCYGSTSASTNYVINPGTTLQLYHTIASTGSTTAYWLGMAVYWSPTVPTNMTTIGNPFTTCSVMPNHPAPGQPQMAWSSQYIIDIH